LTDSAYVEIAMLHRQIAALSNENSRLQFTPPNGSGFAREPRTFERLVGSGRSRKAALVRFKAVYSGATKDRDNPG
jgi:hypothetical protein